MKRIIIAIAVIFTVGLLGMIFSETGNAVSKVAICHVPPGNPQNLHSILVGYPAITAHFDHGDSLGKCLSSELDPCDSEGNLNECMSDGIYY